MRSPAPAGQLAHVFHRRTLLQAGFSGLVGVGLASLPGRHLGAAPQRPPRSVILIFQTGAPSHLDTFDPKPDAPAEIRGEFRPIATRLPEGLEIDRLHDRRTLLAEVDRQQARLAELATARRLSDQQQLAFSVLTSGRVATAFELDREPLPVRERYGRHAFGQSLLLAR